MTASVIDDTAGIRPGSRVAGRQADLSDSSDSLASTRVVIAARPGSARDWLSDRLERMGAQTVEVADNGADALLALQGMPTQILIADHQLSDGIDARTLHQQAMERYCLTLHALFVVIGGNRQNRTVMSIAEFEPDACLIKPFILSDVEVRLTRAWTRKQQLAGLYDAMIAVDLPAVALELHRVALEHPELLNGAKRIASAWLLEAGDLESAETLARDVLQGGQPAWALCRLAQVRLRQDRPDDAGKLLKRALKNNPRHLGSLDLMVDLREKQGRHQEALACLDQVSEMTEPTPARVRRTGRLSRQTGDLQRAEGAFRWVAARVAPDSVEAIEDQADLVSVLQAQGRLNTADTLHRAQARQLEGLPDAELLGALFALEKASQQRDRRAVESSGRRLLAAFEQATETVSVPLALRGVTACQEAGLRRLGFAMAAAISRSHRASRVELDQLRHLLTGLGELPTDD